MLRWHKAKFTHSLWCTGHWCGGEMVIDSVHRVVALDKLLTPVCLCHHAV